MKKSRIESFMPQLIRLKHPEFMTRYNKTGQSYIINNKVTMFIKKSNGYVIPVELYIKFHYSIDYEYTFLAVIKPFYEMAPFSNGVRYNINQLLFLIVEMKWSRTKSLKTSRILWSTSILMNSRETGLKGICQMRSTKTSTN